MNTNDNEVLDVDSILTRKKAEMARKMSQKGKKKSGLVRFLQGVDNIMR